MFRARLSVSSRFILVLAIGFTFQAGISIVSLLLLKQALLQERTSETKQLLDTAYSTVDFYYSQAKNGQMPDALAQKAAVDAVLALGSGNHNDFHICSKGSASVSPIAGQPVNACSTPQKEGVAKHSVRMPGETQLKSSIRSTRFFGPWSWFIGTDASVDDLDIIFRHQAFTFLWVFLGLIGIASSISFLLSHDLAFALKRLSVRVTSVVKGEYESDVPGTERADEVGTMARALMVLRDNSKEAAELRLDQLTGLPNRKLLMDRLKQVMATSKRTLKYSGLLLVDMDQFKSLNDTQGHDIGDTVLKEVAQRLCTAVRSGDTVARMGSDEFIVLVVDLALKEQEAATIVETIGDKILASLREPFQLGSLSHFTSASVGLTLFTGEDASAEELLKQADLALYKSKDKGRDGCRFFDPQMEEMVRERAELDEDLRQAAAEKQFKLHYQPQIGPGGRVVGAEALIRWHHSRRGFVPPADFIPLAEDNGLILSLGQWVLETACEQLTVWATRTETHSLQVAVNVSSRQFQRPDFVEQVLDTLERTGANPRRLELELTESLLVENVDDVIEKMTALKTRGVRFSLDDFGTGYSSLSYLKRMPLDTLKIDRSFVRDLLTDPNDAAIAKTVVALAHALGLNVIAEGVETMAQKNLLAALGCHTYQGFLFSRAVPAEDFEDFVQDTNEARDRIATNFR